MHVTQHIVRGVPVTTTGEAAVHRSDVKPLGVGIEVIGWTDGKHIGASVFHYGHPIWEKTKYRITSGERRHGFAEGSPSYSVEVGGVTLLVLICKEILFPQDWWHVRADAVIHQVGFPMYDKYQADAWRALHRAASLHVGGPVLVQSSSLSVSVPVIVSVNGDEPDDEAAISGVILEQISMP